MKERTEGFLRKDKIDQDGEVFDYISELHEYLWKFVRVVYPRARGDLDRIVDDALEASKVMIFGKDTVIRKFMDDKEMKHMVVMEKWLDVYEGKRIE